MVLVKSCSQTNKSLTDQDRGGCYRHALQTRDSHRYFFYAGLSSIWLKEIIQNSRLYLLESDIYLLLLYSCKAA